ncbi:PD-(D/E)XK nuclease family protein [Sandaracinobacteroides saxicola]|uniref:PD-(D/E)XK nuclease family protein n=1 Tax=Sandaracinobacteroides saxicola TaxID=2759707 RepID=A0A7G5IE52_9SPHN|nr:PD-(D/E)XK nuclease family protein [Sandaracinobacteroides saxicola]QMW21644.1 PD-(D/E)XK nuclease family protein [Sandaracinobacteroides saxicola]
MELPIKRPDRIVPDYSLTGDVLSFSRCQRSYRYYNGSALPPSRPVQMWYGEFIHGMMERTFRLWQDRGGLPFPLPYTPVTENDMPGEPPAGTDPLDLRAIGWPIEQALAHQGKFARSADARISAYERAEAAVNQLGPHLFPLIDVAERKVLGTRPLPASEEHLAERAARYVLQGIIDVLGHTQLDGQPSDNAIKRAIMDANPHLAGEYEIIIDYKGSRRPRVDDNPRGDWKLGEWQVQTYSWLRSQQIDARPVAAGILIYVSELSPGSKEMTMLRTEMRNGSTDVVPVTGTPEYYQVSGWTPGSQANLSLEFRLKRAIRVIPVTPATMTEATTAIDGVVRAIEDRVAHERQSMQIKQSWPADSNDPDTCVACDFRVSCEHYNNDVREA